MLESQTIRNREVLVKGLTKKELLDFAKKYLKKHAFVSSKKLATSCLYERYNITYKDTEYTRISRSLSHRFRHIVMLLTQDGKIVPYNNSSLYKRVDIDKSLSIDITQPGPVQKTKLIYYQGRFLNPKFYDIK